MKKITQLFAGTIFMLLTVNASFSQTEYQLDSIQKFDWDTNMAIFEMTDRQHFTYANGGTKETFHISFFHNGIEWNPVERLFKTYNEFNNILFYTGDSYDPTFDVWYIGDARIHYNYDASQNNTEIYRSFTDDGGATWVDRDPFLLFTYNNDNLVTIKTERYYDFIQMDMNNLDQTLIGYNGLLKADEIYQLWHNSTSTWSDEEKTDFTYSADLPVQEDTYFWFTNDWATQAYKRQLNTYASNQLIEKITQEWRTGSGGFWENTKRTTWSIDTNGNIQEILTFTWDDNTSVWLNEEQELWYWTEAGAILGVADENKLSINIYPNPTTDFFIISNLNEKATMAMFDVQGKRVMNYDLDNHQNPKIYTNKFNSGIYFLKIATDTGTVSKKLIIK